MSTQLPPTPGQLPFFKDEAEFQAFLKRVIVEEVHPELERALAPLTEKQASLMVGLMADADRARATSKIPKGHMFARHCRAMALGHLESKQNDPDAAIFAVKKYWGKDDPVLKGLEETKRLKAVGASTVANPESLGNLVTPVWSSEFIELLRAKPVVRKIARIVPNPTGSLTMRRQTASGIAYWVGEGQVITPSKPAVGTMNFLRKKLAGLSVLSNDLIRFTGGYADKFVLDDLLQVIALAEDLALLRSDGTEYAPKGMRYWLAASHVFAQTGVTLAAVDADFSKALRLVEESNISLDGDDIYWILIPRTFWGLWNLAPTTDTGARPYREGLDAKPPRILGQQALKTNQIPKNLGGGTETETYCVHGPSLMIADTLNTMVDIFPGGAYSDGGVVVSGISQDETVIRLIREMDFNMRYPEAGACITGVTLGS